MSTKNAIAEVTSAEAPSAESCARRNALCCVAIVTLAVLVTHPVLEMGITDDPSYVHTALEFARTGHFVYNAWATAMLGWQIIWGALFIKLFGFSFTIVRLSTLPIAMASVYLMHQILVRFGVSAWNAILGTLALGLSPMFLVLTTSFMSDIPGLFSLLLCLYLCQRALLSTNTQSALMWLTLAAVSNVVTGTARQISWLGALALVPSTAWLLRSRRGVLQAAILLWLGSAGAIVLIMRWFALQPYALSESTILRTFFSNRITHTFIHNFVFRIVLMVLSLALFCLPVVLGFLPKVRHIPRRFFFWYSVAALVCADGFVAVFRHSPVLGTLPHPPWLGYTVNIAGLTTGGDVLGVRPSAWPLSVRYVLFVAVMAALFSFFGVLVHSIARACRDLCPSSQISWWQILVLTLPFTVCYAALLMPRALFYNDVTGLLDRYLLPIFVSVIVLTLRFYEDRFRESLPSISVAVLAVFSIYGIAATHDLFSMDRARLETAEEVRRSGVPREQIQAGFEYDFWTQIEAMGYMNEPRIRNPPGDYHHTVSDNARTVEHLFWYSGWTPTLHPKYVVVFAPQPFLKPTQFPDVPYRTWLPPFQSKFYVEQVP